MSPLETPEQVREACLRLLAARPRSRHELITRMARRGAPSELVEPILDRLAEVELIDDAAFARAWVQNRHTFLGRGRRALTMELRAKGIDDELVRSAVAQVDDDSEWDRAVELIQRKLSTVAVPVEPRERATVIRRLTAHLLRRGYPMDVAVAVVSAELVTGNSHAVDE